LLLLTWKLQLQLPKRLDQIHLIDTFLCTP